MKIFLSWSGGLSHEVAKALDAWLPQVMNALQPWLSSQDIDKGARWFEEIGATLSSTDFGILCLTQTNINAPWILFEAGALSKSLGQARVCPLLVNVKNSDLQGPLAQFNTAGISKDEIFRLIQSVNVRLPDDKRRTELQLAEAFEVWWPRLAVKLDEAVSRSSTEEAMQPKLQKRSVEDILDEILELARLTANELRPPAEAYWGILETLASQKVGAAGYPSGSLGQLADELNKPVELLVEQLLAAGINKTDPHEKITEGDKHKLLAYLKAKHMESGGKKKINLVRRSNLR